MKHRHDPDGQRLPIKLDTTSNGEFEPVPLSPANELANRLAQEAATTNARRVGLSRREFLVSSCGAASTLLAFNAANAAAGKTGGRYDVPEEAAMEPELAAAATSCRPRRRWSRSWRRPASRATSSSSTSRATT